MANRRGSADEGLQAVRKACRRPMYRCHARPTAPLQRTGLAGADPVQAGHNGNGMKRVPVHRFLSSRVQFVLLSVARNRSFPMRCPLLQRALSEPYEGGDTNDLGGRSERPAFTVRRTRPLDLHAGGARLVLAPPPLGLVVFHAAGTFRNDTPNRPAGASSMIWRHARRCMHDAPRRRCWRT